ncbi:unnamed protein product [Closterium sp. Naga37s-1]|nr:unnamed protein product [Closterium sp. Naga37s-1]
MTVSSLFTAFQQLAAHAGFKLPMAALEGLIRPDAGDSTAATPPPAGTVGASVVAPGTTKGALHTSAGGPSLARPAAGASSSAADQAGAAAYVSTAAAGQPGASVRAPPAGAGQPGASAVAPPAGLVQPGSSAGAGPAGAGLPGAAACVSTAAAGLPGAAAVIPTAAAGQPGAGFGVSTAAAGHPLAAAVIPTTAAAGQPKAAAGVPTAAVCQPGSAGVARTAAAVQPCATAGAPKAAAHQHGPATGFAINAGVVRPGDACWDILGPGSDLTNFPQSVQVHDATGSQAAAWTSGEQLFVPPGFPPGMHLQGFREPGAGGFAPHGGGVQSGASAHGAPPRPIGHALHRPNLLFHGSGHPTSAVHLPLSSHGPCVQDPAAFLVAAEALDNGSNLPGHSSSAPRGTLLNMLSGFAQPPQQVLPSPAASSCAMPSTQVGEEEEAASIKYTGVTKKKGKNEWVARIVLDRSSNSLIVISSHFQSEVAAARSIAAASHVMFVDNPTRGDLIPLTDVDTAKLQGCTAQQCDLMVRMKFWHKWEQWAEYWHAAKAKYDEKERRAALKRAALDRSLGHPGGLQDKKARTDGEGLSGGVTGDNHEGVGSKDE